MRINRALESQREHVGDDGFTIVELVIVMLIIAILLLVAVVTLFGARRAAQDRAAQSLAREALASAKTLFQFGEDYTAASVTELHAAEPNINFLVAGTPSTSPREVSTDVPDRLTFVAAVYSRTGTCFFIRDQALAGPNRGTTYARRETVPTDCLASDTAGLTFAANWAATS